MTGTVVSKRNGVRIQILISWFELKEKQVVFVACGNIIQLMQSVTETFIFAKFIKWYVKI